LAHPHEFEYTRILFIILLVKVKEENDKLCLQNEQIQQKDPCLSEERGDLPKEYGYANKSVIRCLRYSGKHLFKSLLIQSLGTKRLYFSH